MTTSYVKVEKKEGKDVEVTVIVSDSDKTAVRDLLVAGKRFDELTDSQKCIAVELGREESKRWRDSNAKAKSRNERNKSITKAATDPAKKAQLEALLGIKL